MPLPEDEDEWEKLGIMFATNQGTVRRNAISDFRNVMANGKIAMKLDEGDRLIGVSVCNDSQHVLLCSKHGKAIRFPTDAVREFKSRASTGVRGIKLAKGDEVISLDILSGTEVETETRTKYLRIPVQERQLLTRTLDALENAATEDDKVACRLQIEQQLATIKSELDTDTITSLAKDEQILLALTQNGYGKRTSAYEYRTTNRGGSGIVNIVTSDRNGDVVATFQIGEKDQVMLITQAGKIIRTPVQDVRIAGRNTQGVTIFKTGVNEKVISVAKIAEESDEDEDALTEGEGEGETNQEV
jgi:DNA gyrase subunit A